MGEAVEVIRLWVLDNVTGLDNDVTEEVEVIKGGDNTGTGALAELSKFKLNKSTELFDFWGGIGMTFGQNIGALEAGFSSYWIELKKIV